MKIGEALQEIKELQSQLSRVQSLQAQLFNYIEGTQPDHTFEDYEKEINELHDKIISLKLKVQQANLKNKVVIKFGEGEERHLSLAQVILEIGKIRSKLYNISNMVPQLPTYSYGKEQIVSYYHPISEDEKEKIIRELEAKKRKYDLALQGGNWTFEL